jgi:hypothetical protein
MIVIAPFAVLAMLLFAFIGGEVVKLLWNWLTPTLFGWRQINFWQAFGLLALCRILFGGRTFSRGHRSTARERIRQRMAERWEKMTAEEREKWRQSFRGRCSSFEPPNAKPTS